MPNGLKIEHLGDTIPKVQGWLALNLPVFMFVYIHFNILQLLIWNIHFVCRSVFAFINLVYVQSVIQLMNTLFVTFVLL